MKFTFRNQSIDYGLLLIVFLINLIGILFLFSSSAHLAKLSEGNHYSLAWRQIIYLGPALLGFFFFWKIDLRLVQKYAIPLYGIAAFFLVLVLWLDTQQTTQRWIALGPINFQPSEIAKLGLVLVLAHFLSQKKQTVQSLLEVVPLLVWVGLPFLLIFFQPDLGTAIVFILIFILMAVSANIHPKIYLELISPLLSILVIHFLPWPNWICWGIYLTSLILFLYLTRTQWIESGLVIIANVTTAVASPILWSSLKTYQKARLLSFINPAIDPTAQGIRYHAFQATTAIGSGGLWGKGLFQGNLSRLGFVPEQHTDFIFSLIAEETGLMGALLVLILFIFLVYRGVKIAADAKDDFAKYVAYGLVSMIGVHALINLGMCVGLFPVVGMPLPFISYGGNSLFLHYCALGLLLNVYGDHKKYYLE